MKIYKSTTTESLIKDYNYRGINYRCIAPIVFFKLSTGAILESIDAQRKLLETAPNLVLDEALPKPNAEWSIYGFSQRENSTEKHRLIEIELGTSKKTVLVDYTNTNALSLNINDKQQAKGRLYIFNPETRLVDTSSALEASFCDLDSLSKERLALAGTYDREYIKQNWPNLPKDFNFGFNLIAPLDQRIKDFWFPGTKYCISGFSANKNDVLTGQLPKIDLRVVMHRFEQKEEHSLREASLNFDTIKFFPNLDIGVMLWHGCFEVDKDRDFDTLLVLDEKELRTQQDDGVAITPEDILSIAIAMHKKSERPKAPEYKIKQNVISIKRESREVKHRRYCNVYLDYYRCLKAFSKFPILNALYKNRMDADTLGFIDEKMKKLKYLDEYYKNSDLDKIVKGEILDQEKNFGVQLSAVLNEAVQNTNSAKFVAFMKEANLTDFSQRRYLLGYIAKPQTHRYVDWGIGDNESLEFVIPQGVIIPVFYEDILIAAYVRPKGFLSTEGEFVIPGSQPSDSSFWAPLLASPSCPRFLCTELADALRLNEETMHYLIPIFMSSENQEIPKLYRDNIGEGRILLIPAKNGEEKLVKERWQGLHSNIRIIPLGFKEDGTAFTSLGERLASQESLEDWLQPHLTFWITEPKYLSAQSYQAAFNKLMTEKMHLTPGKLDFKETRERMLEEQRQKVLEVVGEKQAQKNVNAAFDQAKAQLHQYDNADTATIMKAHFAAQRQNVADMVKYTTAPHDKVLQAAIPLDVLDPEAAIPFGKLDPKVAIEEAKTTIDEQEELYNRLEAKIQQVDNEALAVMKELENIEATPPEKKIKDLNLTAEDLDLLKQMGQLDNAELYISNRKYHKRDYSKMSFKDSSFDDVEFKNVNLSYCDFSGSKFTNCSFESCVLRAVKWNNVTFINCKFTEEIAEENEFKYASFLGTTLKGISLNSPSFIDTSFSTGDLNEVSILKGAIKNLSFEFIKLSDCEFVQNEIDGLSFSEVSAANLALRDLTGKVLKINNCSLTDFLVTNTKINRLEIKTTVAIGSHFEHDFFKNVNFSQSDMKECSLSGNVFEELYAVDTNFENASMVKLVAKQAVLQNCMLQGANLTHANLFCSSLKGSRLGKACFREANLFGCDFIEAKLLENDFTQANLKRTMLARFENKGLVEEVMSFKW